MGDRREPTSEPAKVVRVLQTLYRESAPAHAVDNDTVASARARFRLASNLTPIGVSSSGLHVPGSTNDDRGKC